ncbi:TetR/AcrR family transcriptional regulator [Bacillus xiapuensis]|uniref:TetR/AcrR family transcriptional regulator n=1 Tax=Bacillus xiapuensis TaxID=2014075 RepID=A0ABU6N8C3_9BACI|nr:TetR/AcrR family transcriptional regulator [Bacillus xiapuensis]
MISKQTIELDRREQILKISLRQFAKNGYHKTKISDIVREAGVAQGTFYWYFKSKEAIALEIIQNGQIHFLEVVAQGYRQTTGSVQDAIKSSEKLFEDLFNFAENNKDLIELLLKGVESEDSVYQLINETWVKIEEAFQRNIKRATELGILPEKDPSLQSALLISLIEGTLLRWLFGPKDSTLTKKTANELAKEMVRFEFFGLLGI